MLAISRCRKNRKFAGGRERVVVWWTRPTPIVFGVAGVVPPDVVVVPAPLRPHNSLAAGAVGGVGAITSRAETISEEGVADSKGLVVLLAEAFDAGATPPATISSGVRALALCFERELILVGPTVRLDDIGNVSLDVVESRGVSLTFGPGERGFRRRVITLVEQLWSVPAVIFMMITICSGFFLALASCCSR